MNAPLCCYCHSRPRWFDASKKSYSMYCGNTCRRNADLQQGKYVPAPALMGEYFCEKPGCPNSRYYDGSTLHKGCCRAHSIEVDQAIKNGTHVPRN